MAEDTAAQGRWRFLALICAATLMSLTTWFSATAVLPVLIDRWALGTSAAAWLTNGVQAGFVTGALLSAFLGLGDRWPHGAMMAGAAALACAANLLLLAEPGIALAIAARILTGVALAGVYPPAVKLIATWFRTGRGLAMGVMIGALTVGSALPHLVRALGGGVDWRLVVLASSAFALAASLIFAFALKEGPYPFPRAPARLGQIGEILRNRPVMLANGGYFGHMWELYAMWAFVPFMLVFYEEKNAVPVDIPWWSFIIIAAGGLGCIIGGYISLKKGSAKVAFAMLLTSGIFCLFSPFLFFLSKWLFLPALLIWGFAVVGDSPQFSTIVAQTAPKMYVGTALTIVNCIGFALTIFSIQLLSFLQNKIDGEWGYLFLLPGPVFGLWSIWGMVKK